MEKRTIGLTKSEAEELKKHCVTLFERFGCRDYARFDWRADLPLFDSEGDSIASKDSLESAYVGSESSSSSPTTVTTMSSDSSASNKGRRRQIKLLEINPNPGWCWDGKLAKMAAFEGASYPALINSLLWVGYHRITANDSSFDKNQASISDI